MATPAELIEQYKTDPKLKKEVDAILADNKITLKEFMSFTKKHHVDISIKDLPDYVKKAKEIGLIK